MPQRIAALQMLTVRTGEAFVERKESREMLRRKWQPTLKLIRWSMAASRAIEAITLRLPRPEAVIPATSTVEKITQTLLRRSLQYTILPSSVDVCRKKGRKERIGCSENSNCQSRNQNVSSYRTAYADGTGHSDALQQREKTFGRYFGTVYDGLNPSCNGSCRWTDGGESHG